MRHFPSPDIGMFGRRQRHARGHRIPVSIINGPSRARSPDTAVVIDHFGADDIVPLAGGCACCTVRDRLQTGLRELLAERRSKLFARVTIETNNELGPILRTFATERALGAEFYVEEAPGLSVADDICQFELTEDAPISWQAFSRFISTLTALRGADLLHVKGLLYVAGCRGPVSVEFMQHLALQPVELQAWPSEQHASRLDFIMRGVAQNEVERLFDSIRKLSTSS
jgi:G3E family GTPase